MERFYVKKYDTFHNGLNKTTNGQGDGNFSGTFTTRGYVFTEEQRKRMSEAAKKRAKREGFDLRSKRSKAVWDKGGDEYRQRQSKVRKRRRLHSHLKLTDEQAWEIDSRYKDSLESLTLECEQTNAERKRRGIIQTNTKRLFAHKVHVEYGVTPNTIYNILTGKRMKLLIHD